MKKDITFTDSLGNKLVGTLNDPFGRSVNETPIMLLCHGFSSHRGRTTYTELEKRLEDINVAIFRLDFFGHGESEGNFSDITLSKAIDGALKAVELIKGLGYEKIGIFGSSFGGCTVLNVASIINDQLKIVVCKAPVSDYKAREDWYMGEDGVRERKEKGWKSYIPSSGEELKVNYSMYEDMEKNNVHKKCHLITIPTLIVHGGSDTIVPVEQSKKTANLIENCELKIIESADHGFKGEGESEEMYNYFLGFIGKYML